MTWTDTFVIDEKNALERKYLTDLVNVHEMGKCFPDISGGRAAAAAAPKILTLSVTLILAHTYFGDLLVIRHFEHAWLKVRLVAPMSYMEILTLLCHLQESWATYMESCKYKEM